MLKNDSVRYPALIDGEKGAYGVAFPDLPGIVAMGNTIDEALLNAEEALREYAIETELDGDTIARPCELDEVLVEPGQILTAVPLIRQSGRSVRIHMAINEGVAVFIDSEANRRGMTRTAYVEWMARRIAMMGG
ncbi:MAG: type II toxin-antitoxin system HicB family antitoxin [Gemmatimonadota bacterium]|nr:type II toxin-antitoxin system HicB family antitoxin [Gemmatimonadota bacterium]